MARKRLTPPAAALMHSVRGVGYDAKTAIADLIDNSIAAGATRIRVQFTWLGEASSVSIADDGRGMTAEQLETAMTLGAQNPTAMRQKDDLGRFGLGLKTASLSQCARLVVASKASGRDVAVCVWDLDIVEATNEWIVTDDVSSQEQESIAALTSQDSGTIVLWSRLDRLVGRAQVEDEQARLAFQRTSREVEDHLAMTFHRYLEGFHPQLRIYLNGQAEEFRVRAWDPFCAAHTSTQQMPEVRRTNASGSVVLQGYVLPHKDRFTSDGFEQAGGPAGWISQQGVYVYRNRRLLVAGSWLGLGSPRRWTKDEQHKLARLRLDLPNSMDSEWRIDIKKSKAQPPYSLRDWISRNAEGVRREAKEVLVHRGVHTFAAAKAEFSPAWIAEAGGAPRYRVNREHPLVADALRTGKVQKVAIERALRVLETTIPVHRIWLDVADSPETPAPTRGQLPEAEVLALARDMLSRLMADSRLTRTAAVHRLRNIEPFNVFPEILATLEE